MTIAEYYGFPEGTNARLRYCNFYDNQEDNFPCNTNMNYAYSNEEYRYVAKLRDTTDELNLILNKICDDKLYRGLDRHDTLIINLIEELMNDKERLISNYIYEKEWRSIPNKSKINDLESLYDLLLISKK